MDSQGLTIDEAEDLEIVGEILERLAVECAAAALA